MATVETETAGTLIRRYIDVKTDDRGPAYARLADYGTPVWALIGYWKAVNDDERVAKDYNVPLEYVRAAKAYYHRHGRHIDAFHILNAAPEDAPAEP